VSAVHDLLHHYPHVIDDVTLVTGNKGVFDVEVDGRLVYSKKVEGRHARPGEVLERFRAVLGPGVEEYER
jgi:selT/selW/selH-like putative selenoprotein